MWRHHHWWHRNWGGYRDRYDFNDDDYDDFDDYDRMPVNGRWAYDGVIWGY